MHKLFVLEKMANDGEKPLKKILKNKNIYVKNVNNHKTIIYHKLWDKYHMLSKGYRENLNSLAPIYRDIEKDFEATYLIDLEIYERWLNV